MLLKLAEFNKVFMIEQDHSDCENRLHLLLKKVLK